MSTALSYAKEWAPTIGLVASGISWAVNAWNEAEANQALKKQIESTQRQLRSKAQEDTQLGLKQLGI